MGIIFNSSNNVVLIYVVSNCFCKYYYTMGKKTILHTSSFQENRGHLIVHMNHLHENIRSIMM